jgi:hypothetical protein
VAGRRACARDPFDVVNATDLGRYADESFDAVIAGCEVSGVGERGAAGGTEIVADEVEAREAAQQRRGGERVCAPRANVVARQAQLDEAGERVCAPRADVVARQAQLDEAGERRSDSRASMPTSPSALRPRRSRPGVRRGYAAARRTPSAVISTLSRLACAPAASRPLAAGAHRPSSPSGLGQNF